MTSWLVFIASMLTYSIFVSVVLDGPWWGFALNGASVVLVAAVLNKWKAV